jgi:hypothetical protein
MRRIVSPGLSFVILGAALVAHAQEEARTWYATPHPLDGGGFCDVLEPHSHAAPPSEALEHLYRTCGDALCFAGDPMPFGYRGDAFAYDGHHPIVVAPSALVLPVAVTAMPWVVPLAVSPADDASIAAHALGYCYLAGFHYHAFAPDPLLAAWYRFFSGAWVYRGPVRVEVYEAGRARYERNSSAWAKLPAHQRTIRRSSAMYSTQARRRLAATFGQLRAAARSARTARGRARMVGRWSKAARAPSASKR